MTVGCLTELDLWLLEYPTKRIVRSAQRGKTNVEVITVKEAMRRLSCGRSTIYRLMKDGRLVSVTIRGARRIRVDSVDAVVIGGAE